jgi:hypothetical protein
MRSRYGIPAAHLQSRDPRPIPFEVPWIMKEGNGLDAGSRPGSGGYSGGFPRAIGTCPYTIWVIGE